MSAVTAGLGRLNTAGGELSEVTAASGGVRSAGALPAAAQRGHGDSKVRRPSRDGQRPAESDQQGRSEGRKNRLGTEGRSEGTG